MKEYDRDTVKKLAKDVSDVRVAAMFTRGMVAKDAEILLAMNKYLEEILEPFKDLISEAAADQAQEGIDKLENRNAEGTSNN